MGSARTLQSILQRTNTLYFPGMAPNVYVCDVVGEGGQMNDEGMICPTTTASSQDTKRSIKIKVKI